MQVWRGNAFTELHNAPGFFRAALQRHLAIALDPSRDSSGGKKPEDESRFGMVFWGENGMKWGSLVRADGRIPAGLTAHVLALARYYGVIAEYRDGRQRPDDMVPWWMLKVPPREYQEKIHKRILEYGTGVIDAPPRSGKTLMAARAIDTIALPTIYIAPSVQIVRQTYEVFVKHFGEGFVARLDGDATPAQRDVSKPIVVATAASAVRQPKEFWRTRRVLIIDEFHHAAAETYHRINELAEDAFYRLMFTGTHFRSGGDRLAMEAVCSQVLQRISISELVSQGFLAPPRICFANVPDTSGMTYDDLPWEEAYDAAIVNNEQRNLRIKAIAHHLGNLNGIPTIVLVRRRAHADLLGEIIPDSVVVKGGEGVLTSRAVKDFADGKGYVLIGTSVIGEGVDVPRAGALVYGSAGDASVQMMQSYFRPLTATSGKAVGYVYDFADQHAPKFAVTAIRRRSFVQDYIGTQVVQL